MWSQCLQGSVPSPTKMSGTWQIRSDSARAHRSSKASKSSKAQEKQSNENDLLPAMTSAVSMSSSNTLDLHPEIRTGNDVVEFYAKYGQDSPVKFFYCNRYFGKSLLVQLPCLLLSPCSPQSAIFLQACSVTCRLSTTTAWCIAAQCHSFDTHKQQTLAAISQYATSNPYIIRAFYKRACDQKFSATLDAGLLQAYYSGHMICWSQLVRKLSLSTSPFQPQG